MGKLCNTTPHKIKTVTVKTVINYSQGSILEIYVHYPDSIRVDMVPILYRETPKSKTSSGNMFFGIDILQ